MSGRDLETRERLLRTGARLFAERGFKQVTVRDICRAARANVAAVNYHFGNKLGLYREVLQVAIDALAVDDRCGASSGGGLCGRGEASALRPRLSSGGCSRRLPTTGFTV